MARLTPRSLLRGVFYYVLSLLAAFYLLFIQTASRTFKSLWKRIRKHSAKRNDEVYAAAESIAKKLRRSRSHNNERLPRYKHVRGGIDEGDESTSPSPVS